ncbi:EVE domain-containing protein [Candidatus Bathyarchaeota archaeon]|nr:EVE domain-containing protein [Candidatus Bathyarchaeota archaeon]
MRNSGDQYSRALQDLINHLAILLGFDVTFGRYQGVTGQIGFDGIWRSSKDFYVVAEVKTTEAYAIKTATLVGYIDELISDKRIPDWDHVMGLYIIGRPDAELRQLESSIIAEKRTDQLRIISVESLLLLAELRSDYDIDHEDMLDVLKPSGPRIDPVIELMTRIISSQPPEEPAESSGAEAPQVGRETSYWITPVRSEEKATAEKVIQTLVGEEKIYAFGERTPGRKVIKTGDWICFYASGKGVVAHAEVASTLEHKLHPKLRYPEKYPWIFKVKNVNLYLDNPVIIDSTLRGKLNDFQGKDPTRAWGWYVVSTHKSNKHDFELLTRK